MFIELNSYSEGKVMINTSNVAYIKPFCDELTTRTITGTHIHFVNPLTSKGRWFLRVAESYEEVKQKLMEGK